MNQVATTITPPGRSVTIDMATRYGMEPAPFEATLRATVVPKDCTKEQFAAFLLVAKEYELNPILKEIYAFPTRGGGIQPIVSIDGWMNLINSHPNMDGLEFDDHFDEQGQISAITARIWRKDRSHPIVVTEYMIECKRTTDTWKTWPRRMLRHKAAIQCARYAFGFAGIVDPDEAERNPEVVSAVRDVTPPTPPPAPPAGNKIPQDRSGTAREAPSTSEGREASASDVGTQSAGRPPSPDTDGGTPVEDAEVVTETTQVALLPPDNSSALKEGLLKRLGTVGTTKALETWAKSAGSAIVTLQEADRDELQREWDAKSADLFDREQGGDRQ